VEIAAPVNEPYDSDPAFLDAIDQSIAADDHLTEIRKIQLSNEGAPFWRMNQTRSSSFDFPQESHSCSWRLLDDVVQSFE
jgi:hypothetical protein